MPPYTCVYYLRERLERLAKRIKDEAAKRKRSSGSRSGSG